MPSVEEILTVGQPLALLQSTDPESVRVAIEQLVKFLSQGMRS